MFRHDVRHALRLLVREPGFTLAAVHTLTLGVGASVAVFAVVNAALLRPLPYPDADRVVVLEHRARRTGITKEFIAIGDFADLRGRQRSFESLAAYGVMSYSVKQRTREIGTRLALGATSGSIVWLVMRGGVRVAGLGAIIALAAGVIAARSLSTVVLYGTSAADPLTLGAATSVLFAVALVACYVPARRATRVDPVRTLAAQ